MKKKIDEWIENKKKDFIDYETYFNENININPNSVKFFDEFFQELPMNTIDKKECWDMICNEKLTYGERMENLKYLQVKIDNLQQEEYSKRKVISEKVSKIFEQYLYNKFKYKGSNKDKIFLFMKNLINFSYNYKSVYNDFMKLQKSILCIIKAVQEDDRAKYTRK